MNKVTSIILLNLLIFFSLKAQSDDHVRGEILVQLDDGKDASFLQKILLSRNLALPLKATALLPDLNIFQLQFDESTDDNALLALLRRSPSVRAAQFNYYVKLREDVPPNDPQFIQQWYLNNIGQNGGVSGADIQAVRAWDITQGGVTTNGDTIVIAVIDNGTSLSHLDLRQNRWYNWRDIPNNGIDDDLNGFEDDFRGWNVRFDNDDISNGAHGLAVEGIIGASGNNNSGIAGINWRVKLMHVKINTSFSSGQIPISDIIEAYQYVLTMRRLYNRSNGKRGAYVVATNSSFGIDGKFPKDAPLWCDLYDALGREGVLNIVSTTNSNINVDEAGDLPSTCTSPYLIVVTSTDRKDLRSRRGFGAINVDIAAPGEEIFTTQPEDKYGFESGTSFAAPVVSGIVGLAYATGCSDFTNFAKVNPSGAVLALKNWILSTGVELPDLINKTVTGRRVNALRLLNRVNLFCGSCLQPSNIEVIKLKDKVELIMERPFNADSIQVQYRQKGRSAWTVVKLPTDVFTLTNLQPCTEYECEITSQCPTMSSNFAYLTFTTEGCCVAPDEIVINQVADNQIRIAHASVSAATAYQIVLSRGSTATTLRFDSPDWVLTQLKSCERYSFSISSVCGSVQSAPTPTFSIRTRGCGSCVEKPYCLTNGNTFTEWLDSFKINTFGLKTGNNNGYRRTDSVVTALDMGKKYPLSITPGYAFVNGGVSSRIWIDYNADGDFDDANELVWSIARMTDTRQDSFTVPLNVTQGITRLRVALKYVGNSGTPPLPCTSFDGGEVEDYCILLNRSVNTTNLDEGTIRINPNPVTDNILIQSQLPDVPIQTLSILSINGQLLFNKKSETPTTDWLISDFPPLSNGVYFIKIETPKGVLIKKIVKM